MAIEPQVPDWMPEEELKLLAAAPPASTSPQYADYQERTAMQVFKENAVLAANVIVDVMTSSESERTRLQAAKYVTERVLGRVPDNKQSEHETDTPWTRLFGSGVMREPTAEERATGTRVSRI